MDPVGQAHTVLRLLCAHLDGDRDTLSAACAASGESVHDACRCWVTKRYPELAAAAAAVSADGVGAPDWETLWFDTTAWTRSPPLLRAEGGDESRYEDEGEYSVQSLYSARGRWALQIDYIHGNAFTRHGLHLACLTRRTPLRAPAFALETFRATFDDDDASMHCRFTVLLDLDRVDDEPRAVVLALDGVVLHSYAANESLTLRSVVADAAARRAAEPDRGDRAPCARRAAQPDRGDRAPCARWGTLQVRLDLWLGLVAGLRAATQQPRLVVEAVQANDDADDAEQSAVQHNFTAEWHRAHPASLL
jgi:hypothetical protein